MKSPDLFSSPEGSQKLLKAIHKMAPELGLVRLMEVCGTHTMAIAKAGLKQLLPSNIRLISGPGCPVCVTPAGAMDQILALSQRPGLTIASYGDLLRVPGSHPGDSLLRRKALGASVQTVYSPMDALNLAVRHPQQQVLFIAVGSETTAPGTAACLLEAKEKNILNFSVFSLLKTTMPAMKLVASSAQSAVNGFLCPGHVAVITGSRAFSFLAQEFHLPAVISGFEPGDLIASLYWLIKMLYEQKPAVRNEYTRLVRPEGNPLALNAMEEVFTPQDSLWRGLGKIPDSGLALRKTFSSWDGSVKYALQPELGTEIPGCSCGQIIQGLMEPEECPLFGSRCTPSDPVGPCMVSSEGSCAAAWRYHPVN